MLLLRRIVFQITFIGLAYLLGSEIFWSALSLICYFFTNQETQQCIIYRGLPFVISGLVFYFLIVALVVFIAFKFKQNQNFLYFLYKPNKINVLFTIGILLLWVYISFNGGKSSLYYVNPSDSFVYSSLGSPFLTILAFIGTFFVLYPFSCSVSAFFFLAHDESGHIGKKALIYFLLAIIFNPLFLLTGYMEAGSLTKVIQVKYERLEKCGVKITSLKTNSPAEKAGLINGELITSVNNQRIIAVSDLNMVLKSLPEAKHIYFETNNGLYLVAPEYNPSQDTYEIGVLTEQGFCKQ